MLKLTLYTWVKNVYSMGTVHGKNGGRLYTKKYTTIKNLLLSVYKLQVIPTSFPAFPTQISTIKITVSPVLTRYLYPESTAPIINSTE